MAIVNPVQVIIDGEPRQAPADLDAFTLYRMAGYPPVLVRLVNGEAHYLQCTHSPDRSYGRFRVPITALP